MNLTSGNLKKVASVKWRISTKCQKEFNQSDITIKWMRQRYYLPKDLEFQRKNCLKQHSNNISCQYVCEKFRRCLYYVWLLWFIYIYIYMIFRIVRFNFINITLLQFKSLLKQFETKFENCIKSDILCFLTPLLVYILWKVTKTASISTYNYFSEIWIFSNIVDFSTLR